MKPILKFILNLTLHFLISSLIVCLILIALSFFYKDFNSESYLSSIVDKHNNFRNRETSNNLIVTGGSSNAFGINSQILDSVLNLNTMNFGVHGDIGCEYWISEAIYEAKPGDIVLVNFEYELSQESMFYGANDIYEAFFASSGKAIKYGTLTHFYNYFFHGGSIIRSNTLGYLKSTKTKKDPVYYRTAFDTKGDLQSQSFYNDSNWVSCNDSFHWSTSTFKPSLRYVKKLNDFNNYCKRENIRLLISFPPIAASAFNKQDTDELFEMFSIYDLQTINTPENSVLCDTLFIGTKYHLSKCGRDIYSRKLSLDIKNALKK